MGERAIPHDADPLLGAEGKDLLFHPPVEQVVADLDDVDRPDGHTLAHLLDGEVRHADEADLAPLDQLVERAERLLEGDLGVWPVDEVDVDLVGPETLETDIDLAHDVGAARIALGRLAARWKKDPALGDEHDVFPPATQGAAEDLFGVAGSVAWRRVEAGHTGVERPMDRAHGLVVLDRPVAVAAH